MHAFGVKRAVVVNTLQSMGRGEAPRRRLKEATDGKIYANCACVRACCTGIFFAFFRGWDWMNNLLSPFPHLVALFSPYSANIMLPAGTVRSKKIWKVINLQST